MPAAARRFRCAASPARRSSSSATGEKLDALEPFHPARVANRILDMGDVVSLVEKAAETIDKEKAEKLAKKMKKGEFDMDDLADQLRQMKKMGGMKGVLGMLPGVGKVKSQLDAAGIDDKILTRQEADHPSMTRQERAKPDLINGSRRKRIAAGAGVDVSDVNKLLKMHRQMSDMMKKMGKGGRNALRRHDGRRNAGRIAAGHESAAALEIICTRIN